MSSDRTRFQTARMQLARARVGLAATLGLLGLVIALVPGVGVG